VANGQLAHQKRAENPRKIKPDEYGEHSAFLGIHGKLRLKSQVDDHWLSMTSEEGEDAMEGQRYETGQIAHGERDRAGFLGQERV
jgi:hypothetical protein